MKAEARIRSRGFTLLEMMVAIAILAVASTAVFYTNSEALRSQARLEEHTIAQWVLANQVAYFQLAEVVVSDLPVGALDASLTTKQLNVAGLDLEITAYIVPSQSNRMRQIRWEVYRLVDDDRRGPLRSLTAWVLEP